MTRNFTTTPVRGSVSEVPSTAVGSVVVVVDPRIDGTVIAGTVIEVVVTTGFVVLVVVDSNPSSEVVVVVAGPVVVVVAAWQSVSGAVVRTLSPTAGWR